MPHSSGHNYIGHNYIGHNYPWQEVYRDSAYSQLWRGVDNPTATIVRHNYIDITKAITM